MGKGEGNKGEGTLSPLVFALKVGEIFFISFLNRE